MGGHICALFNSTQINAHFHSTSLLWVTEDYSLSQNPSLRDRSKQTCPIICEGKDAHHYRWIITRNTFLVKTRKSKQLHFLSKRPHCEFLPFHHLNSSVEIQHELVLQSIKLRDNTVTHWGNIIQAARNKKQQRSKVKGHKTAVPRGRIFPWLRDLETHTNKQPYPTGSSAAQHTLLNWWQTSSSIEQTLTTKLNDTGL